MTSHERQTLRHVKDASEETDAQTHVFIGEKK
jgi:hypothetical protein